MLGLREFVLYPQHYIESLVGCEILKETEEDSKKVFHRRLEFPSFSFKDVVCVTGNGEFNEQVPAIGQMTSSSFSIRYEPITKLNGEIVFTYCEKEKTELPSNIKRLREAAWIAKDKCFVQKIEAQFGLTKN